MQNWNKLRNRDQLTAWAASVRFSFFRVLGPTFRSADPCLEWNLGTSARNFFKRSFMEQEKKEEQSNVLAHYKKQNCIFEDIMQKIRAKCNCFSHEFSQFQKYRIDQVDQILWSSAGYYCDTRHRPKHVIPLSLAAVFLLLTTRVALLHPDHGFI